MCSPVSVASVEDVRLTSWRLERAYSQPSGWIYKLASDSLLRGYIFTNNDHDRSSSQSYKYSEDRYEEVSCSDSGDNDHECHSEKYRIPALVINERAHLGMSGASYHHHGTSG